MIGRVVALALFLLRELFRSLAVVAPLGLTLALYWILFEYPGDVDYFAAAGGFTLVVVCLITTLLLAGQSNRATSFALVARLPQRAELLAAIAACALLVTGLMALLFTALAVGQARVMPSPTELVLIVPRWLALWVLAAAVGLHLSRLVSPGSSHLVAFALLALVATVIESRVLLRDTPLVWLVNGVILLTSPIAACLADPAAPGDPVRYLGTWLLTLGYGAVLFALAAVLFRRKDLLWTE